jgi:hypothetical protein
VSLLFYFLEAQRLLQECFEELSGRKTHFGREDLSYRQGGFLTLA